MSMNKFMHPRNIYRNPPDFTKLAIKHSEFRRRCTLKLDGKCTINLKEIENLIALTKVLLKDDFGLTFDLPDDSLVPTVPLRLNYILWLEDIMSTMKIENPTGIDIGCGASCVYSILIAKKNNWKMSALETDKRNLEFARKNIEINDLNEKIETFEQSNKNEIFGPFLLTKNDDVIFDFCLCNPPFFDTNSPDSNKLDRNEERSQPNNVPTGKINELSCEGGEISFVKKIIDESFIFQQRIKVFTTMIGRKNDLNVILKYLKEKHVTNLIQAEFCQGNTTRWGLAWSFDFNLILGLVPALGINKEEKQKHFTCTLKWTKSVENWKNEFLEEINEMGLVFEILTTQKDNQIQILIKYSGSNDQIQSPKKRKLNKSSDEIQSRKKQKIDESNNEISLSKKEEIEGTVDNDKNMNTDNEIILSDRPSLVFQIEVEMLNSTINLTVTYLCGSLGVDGCYKWFCLLKNEINDNNQ